MSAVSTLRVSRRVALAAYHRLYQPDPSNSQIESVLDEFLDDKLLNVIVVQDEDADRDDEAALGRYTLGD